MDTIVATSNSEGISTTEATKRLKQKLVADGDQVELRPIPKGKPMFILGQAKGKTRPVNILYDSGCFGMIMREGVQHELGKAVMKTKGPFHVRGVGNTSVKVNDEWQTSLPLVDGTRQAVEGWTVDEVTAPLPVIDLTRAVEEIKADKVGNMKLQNLSVQLVAGGQCGILLGLMYLAIHPVPVHSLPNGLTIFELQVASHDGKVNSVIGGPHESFEFMVQQVGGASILFAQLMQRLETYKNVGAPSISRALMSLEDENFAREHKEWEMGEFSEEAFDDFDDSKFSEDKIFDSNQNLQVIDTDVIEDDAIPMQSVAGQVDVTEDLSDTLDTSEDRVVELPDLQELDSDDDSDDEDQTNIVEPRKGLSDVLKDVATVSALGEDQISFINLCSECGEAFSEAMTDPLKMILANFEVEEDTIQALKKLQQAQQEGLQIEYRCPRCRSCNDCRRSFATERVSLREEAEDLMIYESVNIDWDNGQIICNLPLRGEENVFLSNNRDIALKVLDQQCYKYHKDDDTRVTIVKAFEKLMKNNQMVLWKDLTEEQQKIVSSKEISHYIPWRVVFKPSLSTPARPVFDASMNTKPTDKGGGRCLNDLVVKGRVVSLNLVRLVLRFEVGAVALQGDLKQFYASIKLVTSQWNLQRILYRDQLDPDGEIVEAVIKTLIWGVKSVSAQSECSIIKLAAFVKENQPNLYDLLVNCRFVDDLGKSDKSLDDLKKVTAEADELFSKVGLACKGWSYSGCDPLPELVEDDQTISICGTKWHPPLDWLEVPLPLLHFGKKARGKLLVGTQVFEGSMLDDMEKFVPKKLTRRMIFSKNGAVFDLLGKYAPIMAVLKVDLREAVKQTEQWDDPVPDELRSKWVKNFWRLEMLRGLKYQRARMPEEAVSTDMDLIIAVDAAEHMKVVGAWGRFRLASGQFSCQLVLGRSLLADEDSTIPKNELEALTMGSNLGWILRQALVDWVKSYIVIGDSSISLCWVTSEKKKLSLYHRNRCVQVRRGTDLEFLYHVATEFNPADVGTRPHLVKDSDVGPNSVWEKGLPWMRGEVDDAIADGTLIPATNLRLTEEEEDSFKKGLVYERTPEILTRGHPVVMVSSRVEKVKKRSEVSDYLLPPNKFKFEKIVRIYSMVKRYIRNHKCLKGKLQDNSGSFKFQMFQVSEGQVSNKCLALQLQKPVIDDYFNFSNFSIGVKKPGVQFKGKFHVNLCEDDISSTLNYLFKKASLEVKKFCNADFVKKISVERKGILFSKSRILDTQRFQTAGGLDNIAELGIKSMTPVLERFSPLSYSIGDYVHRKLARHAGYENCLRESLNHCFIIQGMTLFRELGDDCVRCAKMRKKFLDIVEGPISDEQLIIAPAFWISMCDLYGPCQIYVPGFSMQTRNRKVLEMKCYVFVAVCPVTKLVNLQVIETKSADGIIDGVTRLSCEIGVPFMMLVDQDSGILKALKEVEVDLKDLDQLLYKEKGIRFKTCPVSGHNYHGLCERKIRTVQDCLDKIDVANMRLHATGLQTLCKLIENDVNNLPMGFSFARDSDNSPLLKLVFPNMMKIGRINSRSLDGPIRMPKGPGELMKKVEQGYDAFYKLWNTTMVPKLMKMHKWFNGKAQLQVGDIIYFRKVENELSSKWTVGRIFDVVKGKDEIVRRATVQYQNSGESQPRFTDRAARSLIKLFHVDDVSWQEDMDTVEKLIADVKKDKAIDDEKTEATAQLYTMNHTGEGLRYRLAAVAGYDCPVREVGVQHRPSAKIAKAKIVRPCSECCCSSHCMLTDHGNGGGDVSLNVIGGDVIKDYEFVNLLDRSWLEFNEYQEEMINLPMEQDAFMSLLCAVNTDFGLEDLCLS